MICFSDHLDILRKSPTVTAKEAAELLGISKKSVYELVKSGELPGFIIGSRTVRLISADLLTILEPHSMKMEII